MTGKFASHNLEKQLYYFQEQYQKKVNALGNIHR